MREDARSKSCVWSRWSEKNAHRKPDVIVNDAAATATLSNTHTSALKPILVTTIIATVLIALVAVNVAQGQQPQASAPARAPPQQQASSNVVIVPGSASLRRDASRVDQVIYPYESFPVDNSQRPPEELHQTSYVIDNKRFIESYSSRCMASTLLEDPDSVEPNFVVIRERSEVRVNATAPIKLIQATGFEPRQPTHIFVHGFTQSYPDTDWLRKTRALFEMHSLVGKENLIIMDWGVGSQGSYQQVAARSSAMGSFLANFLMKLFELGAERESVHIIGHSLGAHIAGFAGKRIRPRIGRITGLDAAGPCFGKLFSNSPNDRLAPDDAIEVDVYHYDDAFLGLPGQIGQFDVFVNGGSSQPGATDNINSMAQALVTMVFRRNRPLSESHTRSTEVATSQLSLTNCQMIAYECRDWPAFLSGECGYCDASNSQCFDMAFHHQYTNRKPPPLRQYSGSRSGGGGGKQFYIATSPNGLYCLQHFQVVVKFEPSPDLVNLAKKQRWKIQLEITNEQNERSNLTITNQVEPSVFTHLLLSEMQPKRFKSAILQVRQGDNSPIQLRDKPNKPGQPANPSRPYSQPPRVNSVEVNFMSSFEPDQRRRLSSRLCPSGWLEAQNSIEDEQQDLSWLTLSEC
uniref:Phospholipase A1 member A n=1 Tax=Aceria tosichella TaxID=561515 RepID=A0A6G1SLC1_9ACAR